MRDLKDTATGTIVFWHRKNKVLFAARCCCDAYVPQSSVVELHDVSVRKDLLEIYGVKAVRICRYNCSRRERERCVHVRD